MNLFRSTKNYKSAANWVMVNVKSFLNENALHINDFPIQPKVLSQIIALIDEGKISHAAASQKLFPALVANPAKSPESLATGLHIIQNSNSGWSIGLGPTNSDATSSPESSGGRVSLAVGLFSTFLSITLGFLVGALSGYFGGWIDSVLMRITDAFLTFPTIFVLIILGAFLREQQVPWLKNSVLIVIIIIAALSWMWPARLVRGLFIVLREREFVTASRALGGSSARIIIQHILPNCIGPIACQRHIANGIGPHHRIRIELFGIRRSAAHLTRLQVRCSGPLCHSNFQ